MCVGSLRSVLRMRLGRLTDTSSAAISLSTVDAALQDLFLEQGVDDLAGGGEGSLGIVLHQVAGQHAAFQVLGHGRVLLAALRLGSFTSSTVWNSSMISSLVSKPSARRSMRDRLLALAVDVHVEDVVDVGGELDPGAAVGNDPRAEQASAVGMDLVAEEHARATGAAGRR